MRNKIRKYKNRCKKEENKMNDIQKNSLKFKKTLKEKYENQPYNANGNELS